MTLNARTVFLPYLSCTRLTCALRPLAGLGSVHLLIAEVTLIRFLSLSIRHFIVAGVCIIHHLALRTRTANLSQLASNGSYLLTFGSSHCLQVPLLIRAVTAAASTLRAPAQHRAAATRHDIALTASDMRLCMTAHVSAHLLCAGFAGTLCALSWLAGIDILVCRLGLSHCLPFKLELNFQGRDSCGHVPGNCISRRLHLHAPLHQDAYLSKPRL